MLVGREIQRDMRKMASINANSILSSESVTEFEWSTLIEELHNNAPVLLSILQAASKTRVPRSNNNAVIGMCVAILLKQRNPMMSLLQKIISLVLYSSHTSKQVLISHHIALYTKFYTMTFHNNRYMNGCRN